MEYFPEVLLFLLHKFDKNNDIHNFEHVEEVLLTNSSSLILKLEGFNVIRNHRSRNGGGVCIYI